MKSKLAYVWFLAMVVGSVLLLKAAPRSDSSSKGGTVQAAFRNALKQESVHETETLISTQENPQIRILKEVLKAGNDNDPRMDRDLKVLSRDTKDEMVRFYQNLAREKRNELGTIVFLIGRNLTDVQDILFMKSVLDEKPCLSLKNCNEAAAPARNETARVINTSEISASYPELMAIRALKLLGEDLLSDKNAGGMSRPLLEATITALSSAAHSPNMRVAQAAGAALKKLSL